MKNRAADNTYYINRLYSNIPDVEKHTIRNKLVEINMGLVASRAKRYYNGFVAMDDLISEGVLGLIHAIETFDTEKKVALSTYATWWIDQKIRKLNKTFQTAIKYPTANREVPTVTSLDKMLEETGDFLMDSTEPENIDLVSILKDLPMMEKYVICCRLGVLTNKTKAKFVDQKQTLSQISENTGKTPQRMKQIESSALKKIKERLWKEF